MNQRAGGRAAGPGLVPLRVVIGTVFVMHGQLKLFTMGVAGVTGFMASLGIPLPRVAAVVVTAVELLGGLALLLGFRARWAGLLLAFGMAVAIGAGKLPCGVFPATGVRPRAHAARGDAHLRDGRLRGMVARQGPGPLGRRLRRRG